MMRSCSSQYVTGSDSPEGQCDLLAEEVLVGGQIIGLVYVHQRGGSLVRLGRKIARLPAGIFVIGRDDHKEAKHAHRQRANNRDICPVALGESRQRDTLLFVAPISIFHAALRQEKGFSLASSWRCGL